YFCFSIPAKQAVGHRTNQRPRLIGCQLVWVGIYRAPHLRSAAPMSITAAHDFTDSRSILATLKCSPRGKLREPTGDAQNWDLAGQNNRAVTHFEAHPTSVA